MSIVTTAAMEERDASREPAPPIGRGRVVAIVAIGYLAAAGALLAALLLPVG